MTARRPAPPDPAHPYLCFLQVDTPTGELMGSLWTARYADYNETTDMQGITPRLTPGPMVMVPYKLLVLCLDDEPVAQAIETIVQTFSRVEDIDIAPVCDALLTLLSTELTAPVVALKAACVLGGMIGQRITEAKLGVPPLATDVIAGVLLRGIQGAESKVARERAEETFRRMMFGDGSGLVS